ncbi:MAG: DNA repair protein RecN [Oscillospiraceae bacterium]|nr:DNA repair protein RecN [Oscillospiraceae bacterium]
MLRELTIENVAVIEKASIDFKSGFTCLTGETGAGKSIIIDSINAIMGDRVSKDVIRTGAQKASIVAVFENLNDKIIKTAQEFDIDISEECIVSRIISAEGKNSARINGMPVPVSVIKSIFSEAINIHGQHDNQSLLDSTKHLDILDSFGTDPVVFKVYSDIYEDYCAVSKKIKELSSLEKSKQEDLELLQFQVDEIYNADLSEEEEKNLDEQKKLIKNSENIMSALSTAYQMLSGDDEFMGACSALQEAEGEVSAVSEFSEKMSAISETLIDISDKAQDIMYEIRNIIDDFEFDPKLIDEIEERLDTYYKLKRKYGGSVEAVLDYYNRASEKLDNIEFAQEKLEQLKAQRSEILAKLKIQADKLTKERQKQFDLMAGEIQKSLEFLNMPFVKLSLHIEEKEYSADGKDQLEFYIVTNKGETPKPLAKIASGGELSRIMLAIKSVMAEKQITDTMIFDEIDAGVSGSASLKIGRLLRQTAQNRQVFCVTHSPQIAAFADTHLYIEKQTKDNATFTSVRQLEYKQRVEEIARIISGENITATAMQNAQEMLANAQNS